MPRLLIRLGHLLLCAAALTSAASSALAAVTLHFAIDMGAEVAAGRFDPRVDTVGVRGAASPLSWGRSVLAAGGPAVYTVTVRLDDAWAEGAPPLAYKFKIERPGQAGDGWEAGANRVFVLRDGEQRIERAWGSGGEAPALRRTGQIERIAPQPSAFVAPREVQVWLPPGYDAQLPRRYPVLYLLDGQNVFDAAGAGVEWGVDETAQRLVAAGEIEPAIIVAVNHDGASRIDDYTPVPGRVAADAAPVGGGAARHALYLARELKPLIDARYRTQPAPASTAVGGASLGGLASLWLAVQHGDTFGAALVLSPTVLWADFAILDEVRRAAPPLPPRIWLHVGERELPVMRDGARRLCDALQARGWAPACAELPGAGHDEASWAARVEPMLRYLYARP